MSIYLLKIKKQQYQLELSTTDKEAVANQLALWIQKSSEYVRKIKGKECKELVNTRIKEEEELTKKHIETQIASKKQVEIPIVEKKEEKKPLERAKESNLDEIYSSSKVEVTASDKLNPSAVFDNILEKSLNNPQSEMSFKVNPTIKKDNAFLNYITSRKIERKIDYLLLTAYYLTQYEQKPRFTLKQLNSKLMQNIAVIIDHSVLQEAINRDYLECLPDLTGLVGASEYRLTSYGEKVLLNE